MSNKILVVGIIAGLVVGFVGGFVPQMLQINELTARVAELDGLMPDTIFVVDSSNRTVEVPYPLQKVVVINPPAAEVMRAIGAINTVVGISGAMNDSPSFWPELYNMTVIGDSAHSEPNYEMIHELDVSVGGIDVVIDYGTHPAVKRFFDDMVQELYPIPVVGLDCYKLDTLFQDIETLGAMFGKMSEADQFTNFLNGTKNTIVEKVAGIPEDEKVRVYLETHAGDYYTGTNKSSLGQMIEMAGGYNIFGNLTGRSTQQISPEDIIARNPEMALVEVRKSNVPLGHNLTDETPLQTYLDGIYDRADNDAWNVVDAIQNEAVYLFSEDTTAGPKKYFALAYFAKLFYPDLLADVDPAAIHGEYLIDYQHVTDEGIFIYPALPGGSGFMALLLSCSLQSMPQMLVLEIPPRKLSGISRI